MANELQQVLNNIKKDKDTNLLPTNLKDGVTCLGIEGTLENKVKLFDTVEEMNQSAGNNENDIALIYSNKLSNIAFGDENITEITFPEQVQLPQQVTEDNRYSWYSMGGFFDRTTFLLTSTEASFTLSINSFRTTTVKYTSTDGKNYTRTTEVTNPLTITSMSITNMQEDWTDLFGYFMLINKMIFDGLYKYTNSTWVILETQLNLSSSNQLLPGVLAYGKNGLVTGDETIYDNLDPDIINTKILRLTKNKQWSKIPTEYNCSLSEEDENIGKFIYVKFDDQYKYTDTLIKFKFNHICDIIENSGNYIEDYIYDEQKQIVISLQRISNEDNNKTYYLVWQDIQTNTVVNEIELITMPNLSNNGYVKITDTNNYVIVGTGSNNYDLDTNRDEYTEHKEVRYYSKLPLEDGTYDTGVIYQTDDNIVSKKTNNNAYSNLLIQGYKNYVFYLSSYYNDQTEISNCYLSIFNTDTKINTEIYNSSCSATYHSSSDSISTFYIAAYSNIDNIYVFVKYYDTSYDMTNIYRINTSTTGVENVKTLRDDFRDIYLIQYFPEVLYSDNYIICGDNIFSLQSENNYTPQGHINIIYNDSIIYDAVCSYFYGYSKDNYQYLTNGQFICNIQNVEYEENLLKVYVSTPYIIKYNINSYSYYITKDFNVGWSYTVIPHQNPQITQNNSSVYTLDFNFGKTDLTGIYPIYNIHQTLIPIAACNYDDDFSYAIYIPAKRQSIVYETNTVDYTGTISPTEYNTALETSKRILGVKEEVQ